MLENDPEATPYRNGPLAGSKEVFPASFSRIDAGRICFEHRLHVDHADRLPEQVTHLQRDFDYAAQTWDSLDKIPDAWPAAQAVTITQKPASARELKLTGPNAARSPTAEICVAGPMPPIGPQTKLVTLVVMPKGDPGKNFALFWDFTGEKRK